MSPPVFTGTHQVQIIDKNLVPLGADSGHPLYTSVTGAGSGGTSSVDEASFTAGVSAGTPAMGVVAPVDTPSNGTLAVVALDAARNLCVNVKAGSGSGLSVVDEAAWTAGSSNFVPGGGVYNDSATALTSGQQGSERLTPNRAVHTNIRNNSGTELGLLASPLRTDPTGTTNQPITAASLPLPTGASTSAKQPALGTAGSASADVITIQGIASMTKLLVTPDSVALPAHQSTNVDQIAGTTPDTNSGTKSAGTLRVVLATDQPALTNKILVTPDSVALPANQSVNVSQINAVTPLMGNGVTGTGSQRVTIASDNTPYAVKIDQTTPGTTNLVASGGVGAAGSSVSGNPVRNGGLGRTTTPTTVASAQLVDLLLDRLGRTYTVSPVCTVLGSAATPITTNTTTSIVSAPSAGNHLRIHRLWAQNSSSTGTWCYWCDGTTKRIPFYLAQYQPFSMSMEGRWELASATALQIITSTTGANIEWYVEYETLAD